MCVVSRATAYHVYWRILRDAAAAARNLHLRMPCKLPMHDLCECVWGRGVDVCMQMKSGSAASGNMLGIRIQLVAFHNFRGLPKKSKCKKSHSREEARLQFRFAHCASHLLRMQIMFEWENNAGAGSQWCRARGGKGTRGVRGYGGRVLGAGCVRWVCLRCLLEIHDCLAHMPHNVAYIWAPRVLQLTPPAMRRLCAAAVVVVSK